MTRLYSTTFDGSQKTDRHLTPPMTPLVDIHTHNPALYDNVISLLSVRAGVDASTIRHYPFSVGVHPWDAATVQNPTDLLNDFLKLHPAAIGEIGLDSLHDNSNLNVQLSLLQDQLAFAQLHNLPVIIHSVRTLQQILALLDKFPTLTAIFHSFIGNRIQAQSIIRRGHFISAGLTSLASPKTLDALSCVPLDRLFLETDDCGCQILHIYNYAASALNIPLSTLTQQLYSNFLLIFKQHGNSNLGSTH